MEVRREIYVRLKKDSKKMCSSKCKSIKNCIKNFCLQLCCSAMKKSVFFPGIASGALATKVIN